MELVATWNDYFFHAQVKNANFLCVTHVCDASIIGNNPKQRIDIKPQKHEITIKYECQSLECLFRGEFVPNNQMRLLER